MSFPLCFDEESQCSGRKFRNIGIILSDELDDDFVFSDETTTSRVGEDSDVSMGR